jgi:hypothetical protein
MRAINLCVVAPEQGGIVETTVTAYEVMECRIVIQPSQTIVSFVISVLVQLVLISRKCKGGSSMKLATHVQFI